MEGIAERSTKSATMQHPQHLEISRLAAEPKDKKAVKCNVEPAVISNYCSFKPAFAVVEKTNVEDRSKSLGFGRGWRGQIQK